VNLAVPLPLYITFPFQKEGDYLNNGSFSHFTQTQIEP